MELLPGEKPWEKLSQTLSSYILNPFQVYSLTGFHNLVLRPENSGEDTGGGSKPFVRKKKFELQKISIQTHWVLMLLNMLPNLL